MYEMPPSSGSGLLTIATRRARETVKEVVEQLGGDSWMKAQNVMSGPATSCSRIGMLGVAAWFQAAGR